MGIAGGTAVASSETDQESSGGYVQNGHGTESLYRDDLGSWLERTAQLRTRTGRPGLWDCVLNDVVRCPEAKG
jgi:hypothetical protein